MSPMVIVIAVCFSVSAFLFAISLVPTKSDVTKRLEELEGLKWEQAVGGREAALAKIFNETRKASIQQQLYEAGWYTVTPAKLAARIIAGTLFGLTSGLAFGTYMDRWDMLTFSAVIFFTVGGGYFPLSQLKGAISKRKIAVQRALPDVLDMLSTTVKAGLAFNSALTYVEEIAIGPLGEEIKAALSEIRLGRSRADALKSMANRVKVEELSTTVTAIVQAERLGSDLSHVLEELSLEGRSRRMTRAEEIAALMPVKMVIPMALFMLPALFVMIFGGVVAKYMTNNPGIP